MSSGCKCDAVTRVDTRLGTGAIFRQVSGQLRIFLPDIVCRGRRKHERKRSFLVGTCRPIALARKNNFAKTAIQGGIGGVSDAAMIGLGGLADGRKFRLP